MKKLIVSAIVASSLSVASLGAQASSMEGIGFGVGYEALSGGTLEINYPIYTNLLLRGSLSTGADYSANQNEDNVYYKAKIDGGINRLAINYTPFGGNFFLSAGYAINNMNFKVNGSGTGSIDIGDDTYNNANASLTGKVKWDSAPTLSLGWGHSAASGWGMLAEVGMMYTGAPKTSLTGSGTYDNGGGTTDISSDPTFQKSLKTEEKKLQDDLSSADFLPILQVQVTYRF